MSLLEAGRLQDAVDALRRDLIADDGPRISTMRNYRFAIFAYSPKDEFKLREAFQRLSHDLRAHGCSVLSLSLEQMLLERVRAQEERWTASVIRREKRLHAKGQRERALNMLAEKIAPLIEGRDGLAAACAERIRAHIEREGSDRTVVLIGRAGAIYPFFRSSGLLRHLDGATGNVPVVLLYPGSRSGDTGLSFMEMLPPDNDYRPRIYSYR